MGDRGSFLHSAHLVAEAETEEKCEVEGGGDDAFNGALRPTLLQIGAQRQPTLHVAHLVQTQMRNPTPPGSVTRGQCVEVLRVEEALKTNHSIRALLKSDK